MSPIVAKEYTVSHFTEYPFGMKEKGEMISLLNILQANGENLDSMHNAVFNGYSEFMGIFGRWDTDAGLYEAVLQFNSFFSEGQFIDWMLEKIDDLKYDEIGPAEEVKCWTFDEEPSDTKVIKTEDGYVVRVWY